MLVQVRFVATLAAASLALLSVSRVEAYEVDAKRSRVTITSIDDFVRCQRAVSTTDWCVDGLLAYVKAHPSEAFAAGKQVRLHLTHWAALRFFERGVDKYTPKQCADEDVAMAVVSGLALPDDYPAHKSALKVASGRCFKALQPQLLKQLDNSNTYYRNRTCALLKAKGAEPVECVPKAELAPAPSAPQTASIAGKASVTI